MQWAHPLAKYGGHPPSARPPKKLNKKKKYFNDRTVNFHMLLSWMRHQNANEKYKTIHRSFLNLTTQIKHFISE